MLVGALTAFVATNGVHRARARALRPSAVIDRDTVVTADQRARGVTRRAMGPAREPALAPEELRRRVANLSAGTYVDDILAEQDSALYRWPERLSDAVRVYVEPSPELPGWDPRLPELTQSVFEEWKLAGFPIRFAFVYDSVAADLTIRWCDRFPAKDGQRIGVTSRMQSNDFLIRRASITVALHDSAGRALKSAIVAGTVRHEIGHALGLNHANDPASVMYHEAATYTIAPSDRSTLRLLYLVPGGSLK